VGPGEQAFGKTAGQRMMAAFEGKKVKGLHKIQINEKAIAARKQAIAHNDELPSRKTSHSAAHAHKVGVASALSPSPVYTAGSPSSLPSSSRLDCVPRAISSPRCSLRPAQSERRATVEPWVS
jgi:hypothetical protein